MADHDRGAELPPSLARSIDALREEVPVRDAWRAALLARIDDSSRAQARRVWTMTPPFAIAAGLTLLVAGAALGRFSSRPAVSATGMATADAVPASVRFVYIAPAAAKVSVVGDFNQWNPDAMPLRRLGDGTWIVDVPLSPGRYAYAFVVDGKVEVDPAAPRASGEFGENSVVMVRGS